MPLGCCTGSQEAREPLERRLWDDSFCCDEPGTTQWKQLPTVFLEEAPLLPCCCCNTGGFLCLGCLFCLLLSVIAVSSSMLGCHCACSAYQSLLCLPKLALIMQVLALFAGQPYDSELQNLGNLDAHLTNSCRLGGYVEEEQVVRLLSELPQVSCPWQKHASKRWHLSCN